MSALHNTRADGIRIGLACSLVACMLLSSCLSQKAPDLGDRALAFEAKSLDGQPLTFKPVSRRVHLLYFWADWCPRCEDDFHLMEKLYQQWSTQAEAPRFLAIDVGQTEEHVRNFVKRMKISFPIYMDHDGKVARSFGVKGLPTYFVIDRQGVIRHVILGWADEKTLLAEIAKIE
ncbi:MAG: TlpA family protein disulfide reductase [Desulfomonile tiedjei]|uniref:TlpA family protein disulfide reductase n=1 Tax=Desulfomonile tiedjei TaxID=2358 RepID=A0A9D6V6X4_9BACT|nr:TlpA family protein disulfide reductase [Desulfomonile tiedjei]